ncbi:dCMP deaminase [Proteus phage 2207-N35]|nr:dCMP deaminase [Proteus phage 2207-N35]
MLKNETIMDFAQLIAEESKCCKYKVGAVIVRDGKIIGHGCNGTLPGTVNCNDHSLNSGWLDYSYRLKDDFRLAHRLWASEYELHAEMNAIINANSNVRGSILYVTMVPCKKCSIMLAGFGFKKVYYRDTHHNNGLEMLEKAGIICEQI